MPTPRNIVWICLGLALAMIMGGGWLNARLLGDRESPLSQVQFYARKVHAPPAYDLVMAGNSRVLQALSPAAMRTELPGWRILNFGLDGACLTSQMFGEIEKKIDPASPSPMILLGLEAGTLELYSSANRKLNIELNRSRESLWLARTEGPWHRWFTPIRPFAVLNFLHRWRYGPTLRHPYFHNEYHPDGWMASYQVPEDRASVEETYGADKSPAEGVRTKIPLPFEEGLYDQVLRWTGRGIRVAGVRVPADPLVRAHENANYDFDEERVASRLEAAGGHWLRIHPERYHNYDGSHLHKDDAIVFSKDVAVLLREHLQ